MPRLITATGSYLPARVVTNAELEELVEDFDVDRAGCSLDEWYRRHYGVRARHWAREDESTGDMALAAARHALEAGELDPADLDLIVLSTATTDAIAPHSVSHVQAELGTQAVFHQLQDACPGFLDALMIADSLMENLGYRRALVIAAEKMTHIVDRRQFRMAGLFADAAGAVLLEEVSALPEGAGFLSFYAGSDGGAGRALRVPAGGTRRPLTPARLAAGEQFLISEFREVYSFAVRTTSRCATEAMERAGLAPADIDWVIPHHASANIVFDGLGDAGLAADKVVMSIERMANASSACVPTSLDEAVRAKRFRTGERVLLLALGAGMGWGATVYGWLDPAEARALR